MVPESALYSVAEDKIALIGAALCTPKSTVFIKLLCGTRRSLGYLGQLRLISFFELFSASPAR